MTAHSYPDFVRRLLRCNFLPFSINYIYIYIDMCSKIFSKKVFPGVVKNIFAKKILFASFD